MSKAGNWVPIDKGLVRTLTKLDRPYSEVEAMFSHTVDVDCGKPWTIKGYAKLWQWSRGKVRRFTENMRTHSGHIADRKGTQSGHPIHFIDKGLWDEADTKRTLSGHKADTKRYPTSNPNPNPNKKTVVYSDDFETFWKAYPKKKSKGGAFKAWNKIDATNGMVKKIIDAVSLQKKSADWGKDNGQFIPYPATWLNDCRWDDEIEDNMATGQLEKERKALGIQ